MLRAGNSPFDLFSPVSSPWRGIMCVLTFGWQQLSLVSCTILLCNPQHCHLCTLHTWVSRARGDEYWVVNVSSCIPMWCLQERDGPNFIYLRREETDALLYWFPPLETWVGAKNNPLVINLRVFILLHFADMIYSSSFIPTLPIQPLNWNILASTFFPDHCVIPLSSNLT